MLDVQKVDKRLIFNYHNTTRHLPKECSMLRFLRMCIMIGEIANSKKNMNIRENVIYSWTYEESGRKEEKGNIEENCVKI